MITILVFILILGFLVFVHELGHFLVARRNGIKADEFGFGFPPRIVGVQFMQGREKEKVSEIESVQVETMDMKVGNNEIIRETITEKMHTVEKSVLVKKWRIIWGSEDGDDANEKHDLKEARKKKFSGGTIYSLNWIPLGGFVKIKGADTAEIGEDSFVSKSAWTRVKVLLAGVLMNAVFAWLFFSIGFMLGTYQEVDPNTPGSQIVITTVEPNSPAASMGIQPNDFIVPEQVAANGGKIELKTVTDFQNYVAANKGNQITLELKRGSSNMTVTGTPRSLVQADQGLLGVGLAQVAKVRFSFFGALWQGVQDMGNVSLMMIDVLKTLISGGKGVEVSGIVGVAAVTGEVIPLGLAAVMRLVAIFSLNLAFINALPIPALDGGRILFILIEKIKGSPVSQKVEQAFHTAGFALLMLLMVVVTYHDLARLDVFAKIQGLF